MTIRDLRTHGTVAALASLGLLVLGCRPLPRHAILQAAGARPVALEAGRANIASDAVRGWHVDFVAPDEREWILRKQGTGGEVLCRLPCRHFVHEKSALSVQHDGETVDEIVSIDVPSDLQYSYGRQLRATPQPAVHTPAGAVMATVGIGLFFPGLITTLITCPSDGPNNSEVGCGVGLGMFGGSVLFGGLGIILLSAITQNADVVITLVEDGDSAVRLRPQPTGIELSF